MKRKGEIATITIGRQSIVGTFVKMVDQVRAEVRLGQKRYVGKLIVSK